MPVWLIIIIIVVLVIGATWLVMERNPHHQFIDACGTGDQQKLLKFLERPQDLNKAGWFGLTPLGEAIRNNQVENVKILVKAGALPSIPGARRAHLDTAVHANTVDIAQVLIEAGADPSAKNFIGESPLKIAAEAGHLEMFQLLLELGADSNGVDGVPGLPGEPIIVRLVTKASRHPSLDELDKLIKMVGLLHDHGANINVRNQNDEPLVSLALPEVKMLRLLVDRGAITDVSWGGKDLKEAISTALQSAPN